MSVASLDYWIDQFEEDGYLVLEVEAAARWGICHSHFTDWPIEEQTKSIALIVWERKQKAEHCSMCGTRTDEWLDENGRVIAPPPYVAEWENCYGCTTTRRREKEREKEENMDGGMRVVLRPNPEASIKK